MKNSDKDLRRMEWSYQLDISENPLCVYQVSDRLLLPTMNMDTSNRNYQKIFDDILRLESMTGANNLQ